MNYDQRKQHRLSHLNKADVLAALYNASRPLGMGFMKFNPNPMTRQEAAAILYKTHIYKTHNFDYLMGRVMKVDLGGDSFDPRGYDRDNGAGAAAKAITSLETTGNNYSIEIERSHLEGVQTSAAAVRQKLDQESTVEECEGGAILKLGLADVADKLGPKVNEAIKHTNQ